MDIIKQLNKAVKKADLWEIIHHLTKEQLEKVIQLSSDSYYNTEKSLISDEIYDILVEKLKYLNPKASVLHQTGAPIRGKKVKLPFWMGSMNKIKTDPDAINNWTQTYHGPYVISDKLDGISCLLYITPKKTSLYTRGNGDYGQDVSHLLDFINVHLDDISEKTNKPLAIRGELIMSKKNFKKYEAEMENARNMVAGIVNTKPTSLDKTRAKDVDFLFYEIINRDLIPSEQFELLDSWNLPTSPNGLYDKISLDLIEDLLAKRKRLSKYEIDGIIVTSNEEYERNTSGNPEYSFAFKGNSPTAKTKVISVIWSPGKDGHLNPRINYEPVRLSGAKLTYTTGFNAAFIFDNKIGPGAIITVTRSGDTIPYILNVDKPAKKGDLPKDLDYEWDATETHIVLTNPAENTDVIIKRLTKFVKDIGVENMSIGVITKLVDQGYETIQDLLTITVEDLLEIPGFQETLANKIYHNLSSQIDKLDVLQLMVASNYFGRGFAAKKLVKILDMYPNIVTEYVKSKRAVWEDRLLEIDGYEQISVNKFLDSLPEFQKFYKQINKIIDVLPHKKVLKKKGKFLNQSIVFTGFRNKEWEEIIKKGGGELKSSVSRNTTLLVYKEGKESASYKKAIELKIPTMTMSQFAKKIAQ